MLVVLRTWYLVSCVHEYPNTKIKQGGVGLWVAKIHVSYIQVLDTGARTSTAVYQHCTRYTPGTSASYTKSVTRRVVIVFVPMAHHHQVLRYSYISKSILLRSTQRSAEEATAAAAEVLPQTNRSPPTRGTSDTKQASLYCYPYCTATKQSTITLHHGEG